MHKFRKKPVVIEAFQMTKERRMDNSEWPSWLHMAWHKEIDEAGCLFRLGMFDLDKYETPPDKLAIMTLEGIMEVGWGDYIIQGIKGELYPCKPEIFEATYEKVD